MIIADDDNIIIWYSQILFLPNGDLGIQSTRILYVLILTNVKLKHNIFPGREKFCKQQLISINATVKVLVLTRLHC